MTFVCLSTSLLVVSSTVVSGCHILKKKRPSGLEQVLRNSIFLKFDEGHHFPFLFVSHWMLFSFFHTAVLGTTYMCKVQLS